ncbi:MAG: type I-E CRISPR-associated protein Cas6/Cse3/CasE [Hyphomicrobiaceae bacterium]
MRTSLHLSRARLKASRGEALSAIAPLLLPADGSKQAGHAHRLVWLLFQDSPDATRDFLWRDEGSGKFMILSQRPPTDKHHLFELDSKPFEPALAAGDRLSFVLRANPVIARKGALTKSEHDSRQRGKRVDVVMDALKGVPANERSAVRDKIASEAGAAWLVRQGDTSGFKLVRHPQIDGYDQVAIERGKKGRPAGFSVLNFAGELDITDPAAFIARLAKGFGSAKAFGNGMMLIRRA